jgi:hypothetical protein
MTLSIRHSQQNDTQHNDIQHKTLSAERHSAQDSLSRTTHSIATFGITLRRCENQHHSTLGTAMLRITFSYCYAEYHYAVSLCWVLLCWVSLCWVSLCWMSLCWVPWRRSASGLQVFLFLENLLHLWIGILIHFETGSFQANCFPLKVFHNFWL